MYILPILFRKGFKTQFFVLVFKNKHLLMDFFREDKKSMAPEDGIS